MARLPRLIAPGLPIHLMQRGHNRDQTFLDERDFAVYRECLLEAATRYACAIHAYALMSNHIHLLMTPRDPECAARLMRSMGSRFVQYWQRRHRRSGALWGGRFKSAIVGEHTYFLSCARYIDLNPVKAKMVRHPADYSWSSYRALALGEQDELVSPHPTLTALGPDATTRQTTYRDFCAEHLDEARLEEIRVATRGGTALGSPSFLDELERRLQRPARRLGHGGDRRNHRARRRIRDAPAADWLH